MDSKKEASSPLKQAAKSASGSPAHRTSHHKQANLGGTQEPLLSPSHRDRQPPSNGLLAKTEQKQEVRPQRSDGMVNGDAREEEGEVAEEEDGVSESAVPPHAAGTPAKELNGSVDGEQRDGEGSADLKVRWLEPFSCCCG